jgi:hypothetical protein
MTPFSSGSLGANLVPLDPRHGVFPNHVMTPLLSTLVFLRNDPALATRFLTEQVPVLLDDCSPRRFNVLKMPEGQRRTLDPVSVDRLRTLNPTNDLWLVFGYEAIASLVYHLLTEHTSFEFADADKVSKTFLGKVLEGVRDLNLIPFGLPVRRTPLPGVYFRLLAAVGLDAPRIAAQISATVAEMGKTGCDAKRITGVLRSIVPLPHDEAYKNKPTGKFQNCFMLCCDPSQHKNCANPPTVFWKYMGQRIAERLLDTGE